MFVPTKIAILAKNLGFNEACLRHVLYENNKIKHQLVHYTDPTRILQNKRLYFPTYDQLINWLIEKHNIHLSPQIDFSGHYWIQVKKKSEDGKWLTIQAYAPYKTQYEALSVAVEEVFKIVEMKEAFPLL